MAADYRLIVKVWTNCRLYNAEGSDIARACKRLEKHALAAWKDSELPRRLGNTGEGTAKNSLARHYTLLKAHLISTAWAFKRRNHHHCSA